MVAIRMIGFSRACRTTSVSAWRVRTVVPKVGDNWPLIESTGATPLTTVLVGDSMVDVTTARTAGAHVCAAGYGFGKLGQPLVLQPGELLANRPGDLEGLLEPFWLRDKARTNPT